MFKLLPVTLSVSSDETDELTDVLSKLLDDLSSSELSFSLLELSALSELDVSELLELLEVDVLDELDISALLELLSS